MGEEFNTVQHEVLKEFTSAVLQKVGLNSKDADITAELIVASDLRGIDTHGVAHLGPFYVSRIQKGFINLKPDIRVESKTPAAAVVDGDDGLGFLVGHLGMSEAIKRAKEFGVGVTAVRNSTHFGAACVYSAMAVEQDMIGIALSSTGAIVVPPGSKSRGVGTNPISLGAPAGREVPFMLDMATSVVPGGKIGEALRRGVEIPLGWAVDSTGNATTDPKTVFKGGGLVPLGSAPETGSYKGFGLGVAVEILCSILSGAVSGLLMEVTPGAEGNKCDHFFAAINIESFIPVDQFKQKMDDMIEAYHKLEMANENDHLALSGERESNIMKERMKHGIPVHEKVMESLKQLSTEFGVTWPFTG